MPKPVEPKPSPPPGAEVFFALVGAAGTNLDVVCEIIESALRRVSYHCEHIRLSELFDEVEPETVPDWPRLDDSTQDQHLTTRMDAGDLFREQLGRKDAVALFTMLQIRSLRREFLAAGVERRAYLLRSLKRPEEVEALREVYGANFFLVSAYAPEDSRTDNLARQIARDHHVEDYTAFKTQAAELIARDRLEEDTQFGQNVRDTFPKADFFVDARMPNGKVEDLEYELGRFVEIIFNHPYHTPDKDEHAMFHAQAAALRSAALGRQVGAAITNADGSVLSVGTNEVPKAFGGQYWADDDNDNRDFLRQEDDSVAMKLLVVEQILERLKGAEGGECWLSEERTDVSTASFIALIEGTRVRSLIEFERVVHAEMAALLDAARRGVSVVDSALYTTTFPCHECARHIVGAGISRLVYIAPYPKSLALRFHDDSIVIDPDGESAGKVHFEPFVGVSPRRYLELFSVPDRRVRADERLPREPQALPKSLQPPIEMPPDDAEVVECPECQEENPGGAAFCNACGKPVRADVGEVSVAGEGGASRVDEETPSDGSHIEPVLSDPAIRFQESLKVEFFRELLATKGIRLKEGG